MVYGDLLGLVKGHFGPINTLAIHPDGLSYVSGGEDGYIRLHHFDQEYLSLSDEADSLSDRANQLAGESKNKKNRVYIPYISIFIFLKHFLYSKKDNL